MNNNQDMEGVEEVTSGLLEKTLETTSPHGGGLEFSEWCQGSFQDRMSRKTRVYASRQGLKRLFRYSAASQEMDAVIDRLTDDEREWLASQSFESYADRQRFFDFFERKALQSRDERRWIENGI